MPASAESGLRGWPGSKVRPEGHIMSLVPLDRLISPPREEAAQLFNGIVGVGIFGHGG